MNFILIDTSYLIFYRFFALKRWWDLSHPDTELLLDGVINPEFYDKFVKLIINSVKNIKQRLKLTKLPCRVIAARDCPRSQIWRTSIYPEYKATREYNDVISNGNFFKYVYNNNLLLEAGVESILSHDRLEADDIISIMKNTIRKKYPDANIWIIANDHDYLQILDDKTELVNLKFERIKEKKSVFKEADKNLFYKIVLGDKSDNIKPVFKRCGPKTVEKYYYDNSLFVKELNKSPSYLDIYKLNQQLIDFNNIPDTFIEEFTINNAGVIDGL